MTSKKSSIDKKWFFLAGFLVLLLLAAFVFWKQQSVEPVAKEEQNAPIGEVDKQPREEETSFSSWSPFASARANVKKMGSQNLFTSPEERSLLLRGHKVEKKIELYAQRASVERFSTS
jgi:hypothetical protein